MDFTKYRVGIKSSIGPVYRQLIYDILMATKPKRCLEIGCCNGYSTSAFLEALNQGADFHFTTCDPKPSRKIHANVLAHCTRLDKVQLIQKPSLEIISPEFDFIFVDGDHSLYGCFAEIRMLLKAGTETILAHDTWIDIERFQGPWLYRFIFSNHRGFYYTDDNKVRSCDYYKGCGLSYMTKNERLFQVVEPMFKTL